MKSTLWGDTIGILWNSADLFHQCEWGGNCDKHAIASSGYTLNGQALQAAGRAPVTATGGYIYSGETFTPMGLKRGTAQMVLQKPGCRPRFYSQQISCDIAGSSSGVLTRYINRFTDGEVWVSNAANSRTGTQVSWPTAGAALPRGVRYVMVLLIGGGGGGGGAGGSLQHSASGGGGGACAACCVRLPENGYATITVGAGGVGGSDYGSGSSGGTTRIACGGFWCNAYGGDGGQTGANSANTAYGGGVAFSGNNADGNMFMSVAGGNGPGKNKAGDGIGQPITDYAPEGGTLYYSSEGGAGGGSSGGGGGGASAYYGNGGTGGNGAAGGNGQGYGGGGGGGGVGFLTRHGGGWGAPGHVIVRY
jgi:hypothetical protein